MVVTPAEIEQQTRDQADCEEWIVNRRKRITASMTGGVAKMPGKKSGESTLQQI